MYGMMTKWCNVGWLFIDNKVHIYCFILDLRFSWFKFGLWTVTVSVMYYTIAELLYLISFYVTKLFTHYDSPKGPFVRFLFGFSSGRDVATWQRRSEVWRRAMGNVADVQWFYPGIQYLLKYFKDTIFCAEKFGVQCSYPKFCAKWHKQNHKTEQVSIGKMSSRPRNLDCYFDPLTCPFTSQFFLSRPRFLYAISRASDESTGDSANHNGNIFVRAQKNKQ